MVLNLNNMKRFLCIAAIVTLLPLSAYGWMMIGGGAVSGNGEGGGLDFTETFETSPGFDNVWTMDATADQDYSTSGLSMVGDECLQIDSNDDGYTSAITSGSTYEMSFMWRCSDVDLSTGLICALRDSAGTRIGYIYGRDDGRLRMYAEGGSNDYLEVSAGSDITTADNTTYYIWLSCDTSGANAVVTGWASTTSTKPAHSVSVSDGTNVNDIAQIYLIGSLARDTYFDQVRGDSGSTGDF